MKKTIKILLKTGLFLSIYFTQNCVSQKKVLYKKVDSTELFLHHYPVENKLESKKYPAMVFFFGGGWKTGKVSQFKPHADYFSKRGIECFLVEYRIASKHNSTPKESLLDAKSAIRFIKENAQNYGIDTTKIIAAGGSAGGQLAAGAALIESFNEITDNNTISCKPNVLVLFNPAIDNGPDGVGYERMKDYYKEISPLHNIKPNAPPTLIFLGTKDDLIPVSTIKLYQSKMIENGNVCELHLYENAKHGFFNYAKFKNYKSTILKTNDFLLSLGYLNPSPEIEIK